MDKNYIVYQHTNLINGKKYIGITKRINPNLRWQNGKGYSKQPKFYNAIQKYGWDNFSHEIIAQELTEIEAKELETHYIKIYNSIDNGYNILLEGISSYNRTKPVFCVTTKTKYESISKAAISNNCLPTQIIENCKGKRGPIKGLQWTYWDTENEMPYPIILFIPKEKSNSQSVYCIELKTTYPSIKEASRQLGIDARDLSRVLKEERNGIRELHFIRDEERYKIPEIIRRQTGKNRKIYCLDNNQIFNSLQAAAEFCGKSTQSVMKNCQNKTSKCGNFHFVYLDTLNDELLLELFNNKSGIEEEE